VHVTTLPTSRSRSIRSPHRGPLRRPAERSTAVARRIAVTNAENAYDYAGQDPINGYDLDGMCLGIPFSGPCPGSKLVKRSSRFTAHELEVIPYSLYYLSYKNKGNFTVPQRDWTEHAGLRGDRFLDRLAGTGERDEGRKGHVFQKLPGIGYFGPMTWLPGVHRNGRIDYR
jgi:hypothetical protein